MSSPTRIALGALLACLVLAPGAGATSLFGREFRLAWPRTADAAARSVKRHGHLHAVPSRDVYGRGAARLSSLGSPGDPAGIVLAPCLR